jgi:hypothetical protein
MVEIEIQLAKSLGWSLHDIDETDASHLLEFINQLSSGKSMSRKTYIDQVNWL